MDKPKPLPAASLLGWPGEVAEVGASGFSQQAGVFRGTREGSSVGVGPTSSPSGAQGVGRSELRSELWFWSLGCLSSHPQTRVGSAVFRAVRLSAEGRGW